MVQPGGAMSDDMLRIANSNDMNELDDRVLQDLYMWVDQIPLSRPKKNIARDFSDGVLVAEICKHFFPQHVELHNYAPANNTKQKVENWYLLNRKVFRKLKFEIADEVIRQVGACRPWVIEHVLLLLRSRIDRVLYQRGNSLSRAASDDNVNMMGLGDASFRGGAMGQQPAKDYNVVHVGSINKNQPGGVSQPGVMQNSRAAPQQARGINSNIMNVNTNTRPSQLPRPTQNPNSMDAALANKVPRVAMEEKEQELLAKDETIQILQAKIRRLEHLVHLKDIRIDELQQKLQQIQTGSMAPIMNTTSSLNQYSSMQTGPVPQSQAPRGYMNGGGGVSGGGGTQRMVIPNVGASNQGYRGAAPSQAMMMQQNMAVR